MVRMTGLWTVFVLAPLAVLTDGTARAASPTGSGAVLRPSIHIDQYGRTLQDVCAEQTPGGRRCYAQRVLPAGAPSARPRVRRTPFGHGGGGGSDSACESEGGGGGSSPPSGTMGPSDVLAAYSIPSSASAGGKIVALVELPSTHALTDVNAYRTAFGIPTLPSCPTNSSGVPTPGGTACFARVGEDGTVNSVSSSDCAGWSGETGLDMDMVSAACPDCSIVLVEANNTNDLDQMNTVAATVVGASAVSNSWGAPESGEDDQTPYMSAGILTLAASGDSGYLNEGEGASAANFPASSIYVLAVGGTTLNASGSSYSEVVWNDGSRGGAGGSGCSTEFAMPSWQSSSGFSFGSCTERASVDVSAAAEFSPTSAGGGIAAYDADDDGWNAVVGTSAASPVTAAIMVRLGLGGADRHTMFYGNIADFNDVTSGTNDLSGSCGDLMCQAGTGWDGPTGLGTPNATKLASLGTAPPPPPPPPPGSDGGTTPTADGGTSTGDGGTPPPPSSGTDAGGSFYADGAAAPPNLGGACSGPAQCPGLECVAPQTGAPGVCSSACSDTSPCPSGYSCSTGYCFAGGGGSSGSGDSPSGSTGGCATAPTSTSGSGAGSLAWLVGLAVGGIALAKRRRSAP